MQKIKTWIVDHFHLLFKSAADNHLRIQRCADGSYQCTVHFASYTELKEYQKKFRRLTVSLSTAVAMVVIAFIVAPYIMNPNRSSASNFLWTQTSWIGNGTGATKNYPTDNNGSTDYTSKTGLVLDGGNHVTLATPVIASTGDASFTGTSASGFYVDGGGLLTLKKPNGASCTSVSECGSANAKCTGSVCQGADGAECQSNAGCQHATCTSNVCVGPLMGGYHFNGTDNASFLADLSGNNKVLSLITSSSTELLVNGNLDNASSVSNYAPWTGTYTTCNGSCGHSSTGNTIALGYGLYMQQSFNSGSGAATASFWISQGTNGQQVTAYIDGTSIGSCNQTGGAYTKCTFNTTLTAGSHVFKVLASANPVYFMIDDLSIIGPSSATPWDATIKKFGSTSFNATTGAYLKPGTGITLGNDWTITAWIYGDQAPSSYPYTSPILGDGTSNMSTVAFGITGGMISTGGSYGGMSITPNVWTFVALVGTGTTVKEYNSAGTYIVQYSGTKLTGNMTYIGNSSDGIHPAGHIDDLMVFNKALSSAEIAAVAAGEYQY